MVKEVLLNSVLIAPCGINCGLCIGFQREKNSCAGCKTSLGKKPISCTNCFIKNCEGIAKSKMGFCFECNNFPCKRIKNLDKRYKVKYGLSVIENLNIIKTLGVNKFIKLEKEKWKCKECGAILCAHRDYCVKCGNQKTIIKYD